jgi:hypothetical protein
MMLKESVQYHAAVVAFSAHWKAHKTPTLGCFTMTYGVVRAFQVVEKTY